MYRKKRKYALILLLFLLFTIYYITHNSMYIYSNAFETSSAEVVMEVSSRRILYSNNKDKALPMASTTKILTAIIVIEDLNLQDIVCIPPQAEGVEGSSVYLKADEEYTVEQLLYGLMLRSGNDCAVALALYHSKSLEKFAQVMNERAKEWGATHSNFTNPHGLPNEKHYTTAYDLAMITAHAMNDPIFQKIVNTTFYENNGWKNKNKMLYEFDGANGVKTGYTVKAGRCLVTAAKREDMQLISVVLNSPQMYERSAELLDNAFAQFDYKEIYNNVPLEIASDVLGKKALCKLSQAIFYPLKENETAKIEILLPDKVKIPVKSGNIIGKINIYVQNQLIFSENLCIIENVEKSYLDYVKEIANNF